MTNKFGKLKNGLERTIVESVINKGESKEVWMQAKKSIHESKILKSLYLVYENVKKCGLKDRPTIEYFIKENVSVFSKYTKKEIVDACEKLNAVLQLAESDEKDKLFDLILESTSDFKINQLEHKSTLINEIVSSIEVKNNEIQEECGCEDEDKEDDKVEISLEECKEKLAQIAEKYSFLNEEEYSLLKAFLSQDNAQKEGIFENLRRKNMDFIKRTLFEMEGDDENLTKMLNEAHDEIRDMKYSSKTTIEDFVRLLDLNK